jgi:hypothetical protein
MMKALIRVLAVLALGLLLVPASFADGPASPKKAKAKDAASTTAAPAKASAAKSAAPAVAPAPAADDQSSSEWKPMPATGGTLGLFTVETGDMLPRRGFSVTSYVNKLERAPGSVSVLDIGWSIAYGLADRFNVYLNFVPYRHVHVSRGDLLSLDSPLVHRQFDGTIYRVLAPPNTRPSYVEDYPFAFTNNGGLGEVTVGVKFGLYSEEKGDPVSMTVRNDFIIPTRTELRDLLNAQGQSGAFNDYAGLALSKTFGGIVTSTLNWGYRFTRDPKFQLGGKPFTQADQARFGLGFLIFPDKRVQVMTEYTGTIFVGDATPTITFGPRDPVDGVWGLRLYPWNYVAVDFGYRYMLNLHQNQDRNGFIFKVSTAYRPEKEQIPDTVTVSCSADKSSLVADSGEMVTVTAQASDSLNHTLNYNWTATGGSIQGSGNSARWNSAGVAPGTYTITVHVDDGQGNTATCSEDVRVEPKPIPPPTMTCSADRSAVLAGERVQISASVSDQSGTPLTYDWRTNGGQIIGQGASVQLDTSGLTPGGYVVTGRAENGKGGAADCSVNVTVQAPPPQPKPSKINECYFRLNSARVDNVCKRILDDVALRLQNDPKAKVVLVTSADPKEHRADRLAGERAKSAKKYLTDKGIADSRIEERASVGAKGAGKDNRRVEVIWVPEGASY